MSSRRTAALGALFLALLVFLPSWNSLDLPFVRDDVWLVLENPAIRDPGRPWRFFTDRTTFSGMPAFNQLSYRPLVPLSFSWNLALGGPAPRGFRLGNLLLHWLAACLVVLVARRLLDLGGETPESARPGLAWAAAALFAVHPVSHFAAQYVTNRNLLLLEVFLLGGLLAYLQLEVSKRPGRTWILALVCFLGALACRENAAVLPAVFLGVEWILFRRPLRDPATWKRPAVFALMTAGYLLLRRFALGMGGVAGSVASLGATPEHHALALMAQAQAHVTQYLANFVWPVPIRWEPALPAVWPPGMAWFTSAGVLLLLLGGAVRGRERRPVAAFGLLAYLALMAPASLLQPYWLAHARPYGGSPLLLLGALTLLPGGLEGRRRWLGAGVLLLLGFASWRVAPTSCGPDMWSHAVRHGGTPAAHLQLSLQIRDPATREEALGALLRRHPHLTRARVARARVRVMLGALNGAREDLEQAAREAPNRAEPWYWLSLVRELQGEAAGAVEARQRMAATAARPPASALREVAAGAPPAIAGVIRRDLGTRDGPPG